MWIDVIEIDGLRLESFAYIHDYSILRAFTYVDTSKHMCVCVCVCVCVVVHSTHPYVGRILVGVEHL